ncbi:chemotaxis protein [Arcobacter sp. CECT 8986]|uniref:methyl-accepting chemotaxis protein n=1 Tax=Arcobacter sp. CECT 8986 TaxID=2044507 RepID=UPI0010099274|nr:methyl-accepting chemotaxis protein [Arcobacter sp. CECT 8986]RXJ97788.1 chemotaxis protein [Arcobacter sp. CECT 8986]
MFSNLTFAKKLLISVLSVVLISSIISIFLISSNAYSSAEKSSKEYIDVLANKYAFESKEDLEKALTSVSSLASVIKEMYEKNSYSKELIIDVAKDMLSNADFALAMAVDLDSNILFKDDKSLASKNGHDKDGRFAPYLYKSDSKIVLDGLTTIQEGREWVDVPRQTKKVYVTEPYNYEVNGENVLMVTVSAPIITSDNKFLGATTIDISLNSLVNEIAKIKVFENGYGFLLSDKGTIVGHPNKSLLTKKISNDKNTTQADEIIEAINQNKTYTYEQKSPSTGIYSFYHIEPIELGKSGVKWALGLSMPKEEYLKDANDLQLFSIIIGIVSFIVIAIVILLGTKSLSKNLTIITNGLDSFFQYLNNQNKEHTTIKINSNDEFGQVSKMINENTIKIQKLIEQDNNLIQNVKDIATEVKNGNLKHRITQSTSNQNLEDLKVIFNEMLHAIATSTSDDLNKLEEALSKYQKLDFTYRVKDAKGDTVEGFNDLANIINDMLVENKTNGLTLQESANLLLSNVHTLSQSSNEAAASIEETAAAIEEITSNIAHNNENVLKMAQKANVLQQSANEGETLATQTTSAMDEINTQVTSINEAITVIDQIAFQTNILSLNAAVEAATAGEAGKGFAVVAQEVRNLASRSAEAAKEIKQIVETATIKANDGKTISDKMIEGYKHLNENINSTLELINGISNASKEQRTGISQINDAVNTLDRQTQQNASVANDTKTIANQTHAIADQIVQEANKKEFIGKNNVKAKTIKHTIDSKPQNIEKEEKKQIEQNKEHDEWESF